MCLTPLRVWLVLLKAVVHVSMVHQMWKLLRKPCLTASHKKPESKPTGWLSSGANGLELEMLNFILVRNQLAQICAACPCLNSIFGFGIRNPQGEPYLLPKASCLTLEINEF